MEIAVLVDYLGSLFRAVVVARHEVRYFAQISPSMILQSTVGRGSPAHPGMMSSGRVNEIIGAVSVMP